jgi:hypothetical protein
MGNPFDDYLAFERMMKPIREHERMMQPIRDYERMMQPIRDHERMTQPSRDYDRMMRSVRDSERIAQSIWDNERRMRAQRDAATLQAWRDADRYMQSSRIAEEAWRQFRQVAEAREPFVQQEAVSAWQRMRQQQESLSATFRTAQSFGEQSVQQFFELDRVAQAANIFGRTTWAALGELRTTFDADALARIERELAQIPKDADEVLREAIVAAIVTAFAKSRRPIDWLAVIGLAFAVLTFLMAEVNESGREHEQAEAAAEAQWSAERRQQAIVRLLLAKHVRHDTRLWTKASSHSRVVQQLQAGQLAIVMARRGKWTLVRIVASVNGPQVQGWMLNKHLR